MFRDLSGTIVQLQDVHARAPMGLIAWTKCLLTTRSAVEEEPPDVEALESDRLPLLATLFRGIQDCEGMSASKMWYYN